MKKEMKQAKNALSGMKMGICIATMTLLVVMSWIISTGVQKTSSTDRVSALFEERSLQTRVDALESLARQQQQMDENVKSSGDASSTVPPREGMGAGGLGSRKKLLFNHLPKAGGKYAIKVLEKHVPNADISISREFKFTTKKDKETHFVIGNIREPCSYYLSLWHYGLQNKFGSVLATQLKQKAFTQHPEISHIFDDGPNNLENFHTYFDIIKVCFHGTHYHGRVVS